MPFIRRDINQMLLEKIRLLEKRVELLETHLKMEGHLRTWKGLSHKFG